MVSGIIKITGTVLSLFVITVLLQRVDNILSFFCGAKDSVFQLRVRLISGCDHCEVKTYHCHGIGNDRSTEVNQLLDRGLVQDQVKQTLIHSSYFRKISCRNESTETAETVSCKMHKFG